MEKLGRQGDRVTTKNPELTREEAELEKALLAAPYRATEEWKRGAGAEEWNAWRAIRNVGAEYVFEKRTSQAK